jgi:hypothetical protein
MKLGTLISLFALCNLIYYQLAANSGRDIAARLPARRTPASAVHGSGNKDESPEGAGNQAASAIPKNLFLVRINFE